MRHPRRPATLVAIAILVLLAAAPARAQRDIGTPGVSGDQLIFFYDATAGRSPFLVVSNLGAVDLTLEIAWYSQDATRRLATQFEVVTGAGNVVLDPSRVTGVSGNAGLTVVTPVRGAGDATPIVPAIAQGGASGVLAGGYTLADLAVGSAFGENPLARLAVDASGNRASAGAVVDGAAVRYQRFTPAVLALPFYFDPTSAGLVNRLVLGVFADGYGPNGFAIAPASRDLEFRFADAAGALVAQGGVTVGGIYLNDVQTLAGAGKLTGSGKAVFLNDAEFPAGLNLFGIMSQSLGTFAVGQRMPGSLASTVVLDQENLVDGRLDGEGIGRFNNNSGAPDPSGASFDFQTAQTFTVGRTGRLARIRVGIRNTSGSALSLALDLRRADPAPEADDRQVIGTAYTAAPEVGAVDTANPESWVTFDLRPLAADVIEGQTLAFSVRTADTKGYNIPAESGDTYSGGSAYLRNRAKGESWGADPSYDCLFQTFVDVR